MVLGVPIFKHFRVVYFNFTVCQCAKSLLLELPVVQTYQILEIPYKSLLINALSPFSKENNGILTC